MSIKVTVEQLHRSSPALGELSQLNIPIALGFKIAKVIKTVSTEIESFEAVRKQKLDNLCKKDEKGNILLKKDAKGKSTQAVEFKDADAEKQFSDEINELFKTEIELNIDTIPVRVMEEKIKGEGIKPAILVALDWLFV